MRVLVHSIFYPPELTGVAKYTGEMCERLAKVGHKVSVVCPPPYFPTWRVQRPYHPWKYQRETLGKVDVHRCPIWLPRTPGGLPRILYALSFAITSFPTILARAFSTDWIFVIEPSLLNAIPVLLASLFTRAGTWLHVQDFEVDLAFGMGQLQSPWLRKIAKGFERWLMRRFDVVSTISEGMRDRLHEKGVNPDRTLLFPNWVDPGEIFPRSPANSLRAELGIKPNVTVALFSGSLGAKHSIDVLVDAAGMLRAEPNIQVVICGEGPGLQRARMMARHYPNVRFLPLQPPERLNELLNLADIHVLTQSRGAANFVMPSKLLGMLASGRPIVATATPDSSVGKVVSQCGYLVAPSNAPALARAITMLAASESKRLEFGARARDLAMQQFPKSKILAIFEQELYRRHPAGSEALVNAEKQER